MIGIIMLKCRSNFKLNILIHCNFGGSLITKKYEKNQTSSAAYRR